MVNKTESPEVLVIDDDLLVLQTVSDLIQQLGYECIQATNIVSALSVTEKYSKDLKVVLIEPNVLDRADPLFITKIRSQNPSIQIIGFPCKINTCTDFLNCMGIFTVLNKPADAAKINGILSKIFKEDCPERYSNKKTTH